jgi:PAS domain S-box-containing protein
MSIKIPFYKTVLISSSIVIFIAVLGLLAYIPGLGLIGSFKAEYIPMAPSTAICFIILALIIVLSHRNKIKPNWQNKVLGINSIIAVFGLIKYIEYLAEWKISFEQIFIPMTDKLGDIPIGIMSPATGFLFFLSAIGLILLLNKNSIKAKQNFYKKIGSLTGFAVLVGGALFFLGYYMEHPLLYDAIGIVPMALTTSLSFIFLALALIFFDASKSIPLLPFLQDSEADLSEMRQKEFEEYLDKQLNLVIGGKQGNSTEALSNLLNIKKMDPVLKQFSALTGMPMAILDLKGNILSASGWQDICINFHRKNPITAKNCFESDTALGTNLKRMEWKYYKCKNNLCDVVTPLFLGEKKIANVFIGQFILKEDSEEDIKRIFTEQADKYGFDKKAYLSALERVPRLDKKAMDIYIAFIMRLNELFSSLIYSGISQEIAMVKKEVSETSLKISEEKYKELIHTMVSGFALQELVLDEKGKPVDYVFLEVNKAGENILGKKSEDIVGKRVTEVFPGIENDPAGWIERYGNVAQGHGSIIIEDYSDILKRWYSVYVYSPEKNKFGQIFEDITERKIAEEELKKNQVLLDNMGHIAKIGGWEIDAKTMNMAWTDEVYHIYGISSNQIPLKNAIEFYHPEDQPKIAKAVENALKHGTPYDMEVRFINKKGEHLWVRAICTPTIKNGEVLKIGGTFQDITESRLLVDAVRESENLHKIMMSHISDMISIMDVDGIVKYQSPNIKQFFGWDPEDLLGKSSWFIVHPDDKERIKIEFDRLLKKDGAIETVEFNHKCKDGSYRPIELTAVNMVKSPEIAGVLLNYRDITENKKAAEVVLKSENLHKAMTTHISDVIGIMGVDGIMKYKSPNIKQWFGWDPEDLVGKSGWETVHPDDIERLKRIFNKLLEKDGTIETFEYRYKCKNGNYLPIELRAVNMVNSPEIGGVLLNYRDISERKQAEEDKKSLQSQLLQSQKMESIGTLTGGIAHDFNNILTAIIGDTDLLLSEDKPGDNFKNDLLNVKNNSLRAAELVKQLLLFSRKQPVNMKTENINELLNDMYKMLFRLLGENISIQVNLEDKEPCFIKADKGNINQVLMNLAVNARDAMPNGGKLTISTKKCVLNEENVAQLDNVRPGSYIKITVQDTGSGIPKEIQKTIFEPFFTTKDEGKGTGLGLSVVFGIVKVHNGTINVYSEPNHGTNFSIYFPIIKESKSKLGKIKETKLDCMGNGERILVVEDEEGIQKVAKRMLILKNYEPILAKTVKEAIEIYKREKGDFALVFSDMILPDGTGFDVIDALNKINPIKKILLSSGYLDDKSKWEEINQKSMPFIQKPYDMNELAEKIDEVFKMG